MANTAMPARWASAEVDATVVAPLPPRATATPTSRMDSLAMSVGLAEPVQFRRAQPDPDDAVQHGDGGRYGAAGPDPVLDLVGDPAVVAAGQPVRQDRRLQGDDRAAAGEGVGDLRGDREVRGHGLPPGGGWDRSQAVAS